MTYLTKAKAGLCIIISFAFALSVVPANAGWFGDIFKPKVRPWQKPKASLVVFPLDVDETAQLPNNFGTDMAEAIRSSLSNEGYFSIIFRDRLPQIARAKDTGQLKSQDIAPPFSDDKEKTLGLSQRLGVDYFIVGSIDDVKVNTADQTSNITVSAQLYNGKNGKLVKSTLVTGQFSKPGGAYDTDELRALAAGNAVEQISDTMSLKQDETKKHKDDANKPVAAEETKDKVDGVAPPAEPAQ